MLTTVHYHNRDLQETQWLNVIALIFSTDLSHIDLPPLTQLGLFSAVFTLPLSFRSALRVISSAIWSIASQTENVLSMTNLITSSQKYEAAHNCGQWESTSNTVLPQLGVLIHSSGLRIRFSRSGLPHSLLVLAVEAAVYLGKAESTQDKLSFTLHRVHLACCLLYCKPLQCSNDVGKNTGDPLLSKHHWDKVSNILLVWVISHYEVIMKPKVNTEHHIIKENITYNSLYKCVI